MGESEWDNDLHQSWLSTSYQIREKIERRFNCCGYESSKDEVPANWNLSCSKTSSVSKSVCCQIPGGTVESSGNCNINQTRLDCCGLADNCVQLDLNPCQAILGKFLSEKLGILAALAISFAIFEALGVVLCFLLTIKLWSSVPNEVTHYIRL